MIGLTSGGRSARHHLSGGRGRLTKDLPLDGGLKLLASDDKRGVLLLDCPGAGCALDCGAVSRRDAATREPHARSACADTDRRSESADGFKGADGPLEMVRGGGLGYHGRDCAPNTNVMQGGGLITDVNIASRLSEARKDKGLSQAELAKKAGVKQGTIGNIEAGLRKQPRELLAISKALDVRPEWLLTGKGPKRPDPGGLLPLRGNEPELLAFFRQLDEPWQSVAIDYVAKLTEAAHSTKADLARLTPPKRA